MLTALANEASLFELCGLPFVTAFVETHFSSLAKIQAQARDSIPHLTVMVLLMELASNFPGRVAARFRNIFAFLNFVECSNVCCVVFRILAPKPRLSVCIWNWLSYPHDFNGIICLHWIEHKFLEETFKSKSCSIQD